MQAVGFDKEKYYCKCTFYCLSCCPTAIFQYLLYLVFMLPVGFEIHYLNLNVSTALLQKLLYLDFMLSVGSISVYIRLCIKPMIYCCDQCPVAQYLLIQEHYV